jgi:hypothetical protein
MTATVFGGCAIHYYDSETGTYHLFGFGHMRMRISEPNEGVRAVVSGTESAGLAFGSGPEDGFLVLGWQKSSRLSAIDENTAVRLEWPTADVFQVRVGSEFPFTPEEVPQASTTRVVLHEAVDSQPVETLSETHPCVDGGVVPAGSKSP